MKKKYAIHSIYYDPGLKELTWSEAENLAYWESLYYGLSLQGTCGAMWQSRAMYYGFPNWVLYFSGEKTQSFFVPCSGVVS